MEENKLLVSSCGRNLIKNAMVDIPEPVSQRNPELKHSAEQRAERLTIEQINLDVITKLKHRPCPHQIIDLVLNEVRSHPADEEDLQIYTSAHQHLQVSELSDGEKASQLISTLEQKDKLQS